ncbi:MAG: PGPGW domain-containing protein [Pseudomonadota bacterium]
MIDKAIHMTYKLAKRIVVAVVGATVLLVGVAMLVTPGPAFIVIPIGLAILSIEFAWARRWLRKVRETISRKTSVDHSTRAEAHRDRVMPRSGER